MRRAPQISESRILSECVSSNNLTHCLGAGAVVQFYRWTGDKAWLAEIGYPIAKGVAEWIVSRVRLDAAGVYVKRRPLQPSGVISRYCVASISHTKANKAPTGANLIVVVA